MNIEAEVAGVRYRTKSLCAADQWALLRRLQPMLPAFYGFEAGFTASGLTLDGVLSSAGTFLTVPDDISGDGFSACLDATERLSGDAWMPVEADASLAVLTALLRIVVLANFTVLFGLKRPDYRPTSNNGPSFSPAGMPDGEEWLWRPVLRGLCKAESLFNGSLRIEHIARANMAIDVADENEARARKAAQRK